MDRRHLLHSVRRIVVKIGSSSLSSDGHISRDKMAQFVRDLSALRKREFEVVVVTSGAISAGADRMRKKRDALSIPEKQALAAVGQAILMNEYRRLFVEEGINVGQILLTDGDVIDRSRFLNARNAMSALLDMGVVPVVNENDTVAVEEIKLGDNDTLAAYVAQIVEADLTILLSDIDGFYRDMSDSAPLSCVSQIDDSIWEAAGGAGTSHGTGGMATKIRAADMITRSGNLMIIAKAGEEEILNRIMDGAEIGTLFTGGEKVLDARKRWIAFNMEPYGKLVIDAGAVKALVIDKKSLLAAGITASEGEFAQGDAVEIASPDGTVVARGISNYSCREIEAIKGKKTSEIRTIAEGTFYEEVVHRDNMIVY